MSQTAPFDKRDLRNAFGSFMTGVTVVTAHDSDGRPIGFTANSFKIGRASCRERVSPYV